MDGCGGSESEAGESSEHQTDSEEEESAVGYSEDLPPPHVTVAVTRVIKRGGQQQERGRTKDGRTVGHKRRWTAGDNK